MNRAFAVIAFLWLTLSFSPSVQAQDAAPVRVTSDVSYQYLGRWDAAKLNQILTTEAPKFFGVAPAYTPAKNAVKLYRVTYGSVIPEQGNRPTVASGLLAVPDLPGTSFPMVSYQHGTVYEREQVPSFPEKSPETELMLAQFAGQGYILIGADYFGMGTSKEEEGYMVKGSHQQATFDMLMASHSVLEHLHLSTPKLFLAGWSQGGFVTMAMLEKLEASNVPVDATATASAPLDAYAAFSGFLDFPRKNDAEWITTIFILSAFSFEHYYNQPGLARALFTDESYDIAHRAYERLPFDPAKVPTDLHKLIKPEYFDSQYFTNSEFGKLAAQTQAYRWVIKTPVRNYYGESDEAISLGVGQMARNYQMAMGKGNTQVEAVSTGKTTHRGTYATAVPQWKVWFDSKAAR